MKKMYKKSKHKHIFKYIFITFFCVILSLAITCFILYATGSLVVDLNNPKIVLFDKVLYEKNKETLDNLNNDKVSENPNNTNDTNSTNETNNTNSTNDNNNKDTKGQKKDTIISDDGIVENIIYDDFQIHFLEFDSMSAGDSVFIKAGNNDILIDAGNKINCANKLSEQIDLYCKDKKLEYVIATHGDQDHIQSFVDSNNTKGILSRYKVDNIIYNKNSNKTSQVYKNFIASCDKLVSTGTKRTYAHEFFKDDKLTSLDNSIIKLSDNVSMTILWNKYYFTTTSDENNYSVVTLFTYEHNNEKHNFLLTGDLENAGEKAMVSHYDGKKFAKLPHCDLFKGGHHGSKTSSTTTLLDEIKPSICCVCTCAGTSEYTNVYNNQFPTQQFINRIAQHTSRVYVTSLFEDNKFTSMNGRITVSCATVDGNIKIGLSATNNLTRLKDTKWFNEIIYVKEYKDPTEFNLDSDYSVPYGQNCAKSGDTKFYTKDTEGAKPVPRRTWPTDK